MPKSKNEFSFPPPGWPSNIVSSHKSSVPTSSSTLPYQPYIPHGPLPSNVHMNGPPIQPSHHGHPAYYIPQHGYPPYPPPLGVQYMNSHHIPPTLPPQNSHTSYTPTHVPVSSGYHHHPLPMNYVHIHGQNPNPNPNPPPNLNQYQQQKYPPPTAYQPVPSQNYRSSNYSQSSTPTRSSNTYSNSMNYSSSQSRQINGNVPPPSRPQYNQPQQPQQPQQPSVYYHPQSYPPGVLPYFLAPPGQKTYDHTLTTQPTSQALFSTYPSRIRTGITSLIQPEHITGGSKEREAFYSEQEKELSSLHKERGGGSGTSTPRFDSPIPSRRPNLNSNLSNSRRGRVNYAEKASDDEDDEDDEEDEDEDDEELSDLDEPPSDPDDDNYGSRRRPGTERNHSVRRRGDSGLIVGGHDHQLAMKAGKAKRKREEMDKGWTWLGDRTPAERVRSVNARVTKHAYVSEELLEQEADRPELLVPITIDLDVPNPNPNDQGIRIKDKFLWNINEPFIDPLQFAQIFCDDLSIPHSYAVTISELIKNQLEEAQNAVEIDISNEEVNEDDVVWSDEEVEDEMELNGDGESPVETTPAEEGKVNGDRNDVNGDDKVEEEEEQKEEEEEQEEEKEKVWEEADCRIIINLDVQIYTHVLRDRIEWDLSSTLPPLVFVKQYCSELGLTGEAIPLITWSIYEELLKHKKDALELDLFSKTHYEEQIKFEKSGLLPKTNLTSTNSRRIGHGGRLGTKGLIGVWRDWFERDEYQPVLIELTFDEIIQREQERLRESRRIMRTLTTGSKRRRI